MDSLIRLVLPKVDGQTYALHLGVADRIVRMVEVIITRQGSPLLTGQRQPSVERMSTHVPDVGCPQCCPPPSRWLGSFCFLQETR